MVSIPQATDSPSPSPRSRGSQEKTRLKAQRAKEVAARLEEERENRRADFDARDKQLAEELDQCRAWRQGIKER